MSSIRERPPDLTNVANSGDYSAEVTKKLHEFSQSKSDGVHAYQTVSGAAQGVAEIKGKAVATGAAVKRAALADILGINLH